MMYEHPLTTEHLGTVREVVGYNVIGPIAKNLACGDVGELGCFTPPEQRLTGIVGVGAMTEWKDIVQLVVDRFHLSRKV